MKRAIAVNTRIMHGTPPGRVLGAFAFNRTGLTFATTAMVTERLSTFRETGTRD